MFIFIVSEFVLVRVVIFELLFWFKTLIFLELPFLTTPIPFEGCNVDIEVELIPEFDCRPAELVACVFTFDLLEVLEPLITV